MSWFMATAPICPPPVPEVDPKLLKFPDVPAMDRCDVEVCDKFWSQYLYNPLPNDPLTPIGVNRLKSLVSKYRKNWTDYEKGIAERALPTLKQGAVSPYVASFRQSGQKATSAQLSMNSKLLTKLLFGSLKSTSPSLRQSTFDRA
jgi:hypothetical protein